jgi:DNA-binding beta-propeller fold protein YncE
MRMVSATAGVLTVLAFYALARELYDQRIALLSTALLAADRWHITFSRIVYELILVPLVLSLQVWFLIKALKTGRRRWWALSGAMLALGLNTYTAYRIIPFFMLAYFAYWLITHRARWQRDLEGMGLFLAGAAIAVAPLAAYVVRHGSIFLTRMNRIFVLRDVEAAGSWAPVISNLRKVLLMFNAQGDIAPLNNLPGAPMLHAAVGVLFVLGLVWALRWFWKELPALYLLWFGSVASLAVLTVAHEAPNARRPIGLIPLIYLLVGVTFTALWLAWRQAFGEKRTRPLFVLLTALAIMVMGANLHTYFRVQAVDPAVWYAFSPQESAIGEYLAQQPDDLTIYLDPQYDGHASIRFIGGDRPVHRLNPAKHIPLRQTPPGDVLFILEPKEEQIATLLQQLYPSGELQTHRDRYGRPLFLTFAIPASAFVEAQGLNVTYWAGTDRTQPPVRQGRVPAIDFDFTLPDNQPLLPPFAATYESALLLPAFGDYQLALTAEGARATLFFDERPVLTAENGTATQTLTLAAGFQALRLEYTAGAQPGILRLAWAPPDAPGALQPIPPQAYFTLPGASNGLLGAYYPTPDGTGEPLFIRRDLFIAPDEDLLPPYSVCWRGRVAAPVAGTYRFGTLSDDGSLLFINGQLVVDNSGQHGAEYREGALELMPGWHEIEVLYYDLGGSRAMELWWQPPGGARTLLPSRYLRPVTDELPADLPLPPLPATPSPFQPGLPPDATLPEAATPPAGPEEAFTALELPVLWTFGTCGSGQEQLQHPAGVAMDENGFIYVADTGNQRVVVLDEEGFWLDAWGEPGEEPGQFSEVSDIAITPEGAIAVLDAANQVISLWDETGEFLGELGRELALYRPRGLDIGADGDLWIADTGGGRIVQADAQGRFRAAFEGPEPDSQPTDALLGPDGLLYGVDPVAALLWSVDPTAGEALVTAPGPAGNTFESPRLAALPDGRIFLTDPEAARVLVYHPGWVPDDRLGSRGTGAGQFSRTLGVAVAPDMLLVTDPDLCRVTAFGLD